MRNRSFIPYAAICSCGKLRALCMCVGLAIATFIGAQMPNQAQAAWTVGTPIVTYWPGTTHGYPLTAAIAQQAASAGFNLVWAYTPAQLDIAQRYGLRAMYNAYSDTAITQVRNHPALYGYYVVDEPPAGHFANLGAIVSHIRTVDPNHFAYINLFPTYANNSQLGTSGDTTTAYNSYLSQYVSIVRPSLIAYDHYQLMQTSDTNQYFLNLALVSQTARQAGLPFMQTVQACAWDTSWRIPNANELRFLNFTTLAYGAQGISYWTYSPQHPNTGGLAPSTDGTPTSVYTALKTINPQFVAVASQLQSLKSIGAYHLGDQPPGTTRLPGNSPFTLSPTVPNTNYVKGKPVKGMLLGLFGPDSQLSHATYALVVNLNYAKSVTTTVNGPGDLAIFDPLTSLWSPTAANDAHLSLLPGGGTLVALRSVVLGAKGDANSDGKVDDDDLSILLSNWAATGYWAQGDFSGDGWVLDSDLGLLLANWTGAVAGDASVPEPATWALLGLGAGMILLSYR